MNSATATRAKGSAGLPRRASRSPRYRCVIRLLLRFLYWLVVLAISLALVVALILFFESRDESSVEGSTAQPLLTSVA
jgi:hypothetical protein